jgi:hypothetical protein
MGAKIQRTRDYNQDKEGWLLLGGYSWCPPASNFGGDSDTILNKIQQNFKSNYVWE